MLVKLIEVFKPEGHRVHLDEIHVSPSAVTTIRREPEGQLINEAHSLGISNDAQFSRITIMEGSLSRSIVVVGSPAELRMKLNKRQLLRD
tara:strand:- start:576 stop:845 length:270 start_codon:yes stop_codon:yes gene_type:complete